MNRRPVIVVEDDPFPRLLQAFLAAADDPERSAAIADFLAHDVPDYAAWLAAARERAQGLYPAHVELVGSQEALRASLHDADAVVIESLRIGAEELSRAPRLRVVQKYGTVLRNIDADACASRAVTVLTLRRRANVACAEHAFALLLALARKLKSTDGRLTFERLRAAGYAPGLFDARHTPNSNWARVSGLRTLYGASAGIVGLGEIGREVAVRAAAFGMHLSYYQRTRLPASEECLWNAEYRELAHLLAWSDVVFVTLPLNASTRSLLGMPELRQMKAGAMLINVSRAAIVERAALADALSSGRLAGLGLDTYYEEPAREDDEMIGHPNAVITPRIAAQPRHNALADLADVMASLARALDAR